ncbi:DNCLI [Mytilus edulis]|uniref:DYNC1LI n=1 Tax=Mytilus edulis TaxID=6550 RepID=A0A8S3UHB6_MYTED|nr:DNCLI [Mytilus edulis]
MKSDLVRLRFQKLNFLDNTPNESIDSATSNDELLDVLQSPVIERIPKITNIVLRIASDALALDASMMKKRHLEVPTRLADIDMWKNVLHQVHERHVTLRTLLLPDQNARFGIVKHIVKPEDAFVDFRVVPLHELEHDGKLPPDITQYLFNPSKDFPMRVMFAKDEKMCFVRIVFSQLLLDITSILIVVNDLSGFENP